MSTAYMSDSFLCLVICLHRRVSFRTVCLQWVSLDFLVINKHANRHLQAFDLNEAISFRIAEVRNNRLEVKFRCFDRNLRALTSEIATFKEILLILHYNTLMSIRIYA